MTDVKDFLKEVTGITFPMSEEQCREWLKKAIHRQRQKDEDEARREFSRDRDANGPGR